MVVYLLLTNFYIEPPTYRFLLKVSSLTRSINSLLLFAQSPHGRIRFLQGTNLDINVVPNNPREIKLPPNVEGLKAVANSALESQGYSYEDNDPSPGRFMGRFFQKGIWRKRQVINAPVHCECALALHLLKKRGIYPPLNYIGMSKLACYPCWLLIKCLREQGIVNYRVRGILDNFYFPWKYPSDEMKACLSAKQADVIEKLIYEKLARRYKRHILSHRNEMHEMNSDRRPPLNRDSPRYQETMSRIREIIACHYPDQ